ncbi:CRISPR-associated endonuclease Cas1, partial [Yoonia sp.]|uniref:CRISPR-associated endonuclease Cas1 n=1 Tax=Yoonia sp. TaxID=2212373 RepID=UPI003F6B5297
REVQSFVYDLMEPLRPIVDRAVLELVMNETFTGADFIRQTDGVCRLSPDLARMVVHRVQRHFHKPS